MMAHMIVLYRILFARPSSLHLSAVTKARPRQGASVSRWMVISVDDAIRFCLCRWLATGLASDDTSPHAACDHLQFAVQSIILLDY